MSPARKTAPSAWIPVIQSLFREFVIGGIALMSAYSIYVAKQNGAIVRESGEIVRKVQVQTDGQQKALKLAVAISAESLAASTGLPEHKKTAEEARKAYEAHEDIQKEADNPKP